MCLVRLRICVYVCQVTHARTGEKQIAVRAFFRSRMVRWLLLDSYGTLVAVSAPLVMHLHDSDIPMNVPITFRN